jgi:prepilin-type N-terminal cleavage/methylation domain-containing protein
VGSTRGFTLVELMVVVTIIALVSALAIPAMSRAQLDRRVFTDAAAVGELVRQTRTRAVGRGAAQLLVFTTNQATNSLSIQQWEAVALNASGGGSNTPMSTCGAPTVWVGAGTTAMFVDQFAFQNVAPSGAQTLEGQANIVARMIYPYQTGVSGAMTTISDGTTFYLCVTPSGRTLLGNATASTFTPMLYPLGIEMTRLDTGVAAFSGTTSLIRTAWIPPTGATRILSR